MDTFFYLLYRSSYCFLSFYLEIHGNPAEKTEQMCYKYKDVLFYNMNLWSVTIMYLHFS